MSFDVKRKIIFPIILLSISTVFAFGVAEVSLRILGIGYGTAPQESDAMFHHVHPKDYRFLSHDPNGEYGGHEVYYDKDRLVSNPDLDFASRTNSDCKIAFLGDSFTESGQVAYEKSFVGILEKHSTCEVKNFGVSSYSPVFYLLQWRQLVKEFKPDLVVVQLYSNDMVSDINYSKIAEKSDDGEVIAVPGPGGGVVTRLLRKSYLLRFVRKVQQQLLWMYEHSDGENNVVAGMVEENPDIPKLSENIINILHQEVKASGAKFVLTVVPSKFRVLSLNEGAKIELGPEFSDKWRAVAQDRQIPFLDLTEAFEKEARNGFKLFFDVDIHFERNGHRLVASELSRFVPRIFTPVDKDLSHAR